MEILKSTNMKGMEWLTELFNVVIFKMMTMLKE